MSYRTVWSMLLVAAFIFPSVGSAEDSEIQRDPFSCKGTHEALVGLGGVILFGGIMWASQSRRARVIRKGLVEGMSRKEIKAMAGICLLYTSPSPRDRQKSRMPSSA